MCPAKAQISLGIHAQWVAKDPSFLHADSEDSDQNGRMSRLIWVFAGRTLILLVLSCCGSLFLLHNWMCCQKEHLLLDFLLSKYFFALLLLAMVFLACMAFLITTGLSGSTLASSARFSKNSKANRMHVSKTKRLVTTWKTLCLEIPCNFCKHWVYIPYFLSQYWVYIPYFCHNTEFTSPIFCHNTVFTSPIFVTILS